MKKIKKGCNLVLIITLILVLVWSDFVCADALRLQIGTGDDTFIRMRASYIRDSLQPEQLLYLIHPENTEILLVTLGVKPAYWSFMNERPSTLQMLPKIAKSLDLRFVSYKGSLGTSCFIYHPIVLAKKFLQYREKLLDKSYYLSAENSDVLIGIFKNIDLDAIIAATDFKKVEEQLLQIESFLKIIGQRKEDTLLNQGERFPIGIAMGYRYEDVEAYLKRREIEYHLIEYIAPFHSIDKEAGNALADRWLREAEIARDVIVSELNSPEKHIDENVIEGAIKQATEEFKVQKGRIINLLSEVFKPLKNIDISVEGIRQSLSLREKEIYKEVAGLRKIAIKLTILKYQIAAYLEFTQNNKPDTYLCFQLTDCLLTALSDIGIPAEGIPISVDDEIFHKYAAIHGKEGLIAVDLARSQFFPEERTQVSVELNGTYQPVIQNIVNRVYSKESQRQRTRKAEEFFEKFRTIRRAEIPEILKSLKASSHNL